MLLDYTASLQIVSQFPPSELRNWHLERLRFLKEKLKEVEDDAKQEISMEQ